jgi:methylthioribulose-1-phosphate dehydratase
MVTVNPPVNPMTLLASFDAEIDQLIDCGRYFYQRGWSVGTSSNYSSLITRDPVRLLITSSGKDKGNLCHKDFVVVDESGKTLLPDQPKSSAETMLHVQAIKLPHVRSVLHTHSVWGTVLSDHFFDQGAIRISGYEMQKGLAGITTHESTITLPIFENTQDIPSLAKQVDEYMQSATGPVHGYLIRRHGLYTWGKDIAEARRHIEVIEFLLEVIGRRTILT